MHLIIELLQQNFFNKDTVPCIDQNIWHHLNFQLVFLFGKQTDNSFEMASLLLKLAKNAPNKLQKLSAIPIRNAVTTETGAFLPKPEKIPFGLLRVLLTVLPGLWLGATISKEAAAFLEENDIFVPEDDDDED